MKKCPFCGMALDSNAEYCKFCNKELPRDTFFKKHKLLIFLLPVILIFMLFQSCGSDSKRATVPKSETYTPKSVQTDTKNALQSIELKDYKAVISSTGHYVNIDGSVKNTGTHAVQFIKLRFVSYGDNGAIVVSSEFYVNGEVRPGESKTFTHMVKKTGTGKYNISLEQARFK